MKTETESFIQTKKRDGVFIVGIKDINGNKTNQCLKFDLDQINYPLKIQECIEMHKKNQEWLRDKILIINKKEDKKGKKLLSWKQEESIKVYEEFYKKEMEALDMFLGKNGTQKILDANEDEPYYNMFDDIIEMLEPIMPKLQNTAEYLKHKYETVKQKYSDKQESNVLK